MTNTVNNIKITVEYTTPETEKFDLLMRKYAEAKAASADAISYYKPLADMAEEAKLTAISEQLAPIKRYLTQLNALNPNIKAIFAYSRGAYPYRFKVSIEHDTRVYISWYDMPFTIDALRKEAWRFNAERCEDLNILGNWDAWGMYTQLEKQCINYLNAEIEKQKRDAMLQLNRVKNVTE